MLFFYPHPSLAQMIQDMKERAKRQAERVKALEAEKAEYLNKASDLARAKSASQSEALKSRRLFILTGIHAHRLSASPGLAPSPTLECLSID